MIYVGGFQFLDFNFGTITRPLLTKMNYNMFAWLVFFNGIETPYRLFNTKN